MEISKCFICEEDIDKYPLYSEQKCKHEFHTHCIVTWYRIGNNFCPCCGYKNFNTNNHYNRMHFYHRELCERRLSICRKMDKNDPKAIRNKEIINNLKAQLKEKKKTQSNFIKYVKENNLSYEEATKERRKNRNETLKLRRKITYEYHKILNDTTKPIISPSIVDLS